MLVSCELTIFGLGSHSATGEELADDPNALTAAEAQAFKRACVCFGLGRYLYYFIGTWVDLDDRKRPKAVPQLAGWATPAGWLARAPAAVAHMSKNHRNEQLPETAAMANTMATARVLTAMFSARSNEWSESWANACIAGY